VSAHDTATSDGFDHGEAGDPFIAQFRTPARLMPMDPKRLTPFQRALFAIDGSVTRFIEAYMLEPLDVVLLNQERRRLLAGHDGLGAQTGTLVLARCVRLQGHRSGAPYGYAASMAAVGRLPDVMLRGLENDGDGIGHLLHRSQLETRREMLWSGAECGECMPHALSELAGRPLLSRVYRIIADGRPILLIKEMFPTEPSEDATPCS
jgi:chorismate-pyruvate lyase